ncbi:outer membrane porin domain protein [Burkholderia thailandensis MSMB121]|nr:outer membrane porin domain protein [Burkholderia thailandensis MSMB121]
MKRRRFLHTLGALSSVQTVSEEPVLSFVSAARSPIITIAELIGFRFVVLSVSFSDSNNKSTTRKTTT